MSRAQSNFKDQGSGYCVSQAFTQKPKLTYTHTIRD